jgi:hypothetical protein
MKARGTVIAPHGGPVGAPGGVVRVPVIADSKECSIYGSSSLTLWEL